MASETDWDAVIEDAAENPGVVEVDGQKIQERSADELLSLRKADRAAAGVDNPRRGLRFSRLIPPGAV